MGKKIILFIIIFLNAQIGFNKTIEKKIIVAESGLNLRMEPFLKSNKVTLIPFREEISVLEKSKNIVKIDNVSGRWVKIKWKNYQGWAFDAYLKSRKISNKNIFYLYNSFYYDNKKSSKIVKNYFPNIKPMEFNSRKIDLYMFDDLPGLITGDKILVMSKTEIIDDTVEDLHMGFSDGHGAYFLDFKYANYCNDKMAKIYIDKVKFLKKYQTLPELLEIEKISEVKNLPKKIKNIKKSFKKYNVVISHDKNSTKNFKNYFPKKFESQFFELKKNKHSKKIILMTFTFQGDDESDHYYYNFTSMFVEDKLVYFTNSVHCFAFNIKGTNYILMNEYGPGSGYHGYKLLRVFKKKLVVETKDFSHSM